MLGKEDNRDVGGDVKMLMVVVVGVGVCSAGRCRVVLVREQRTDLSQALHTSPDLPSAPCNLFKALPQAGLSPGLCHHLLRLGWLSPGTGSRLGENWCGEGALEVMGNLIIQARCRGWALRPAGGLGIGWRPRLPVCSAPH